MTDPIPVDLEVPVSIISADLSDLGLVEGKSYEVTLTIDAKGGQTATVKEVVAGPAEPAGMMVLQNLTTGSAYLARKTFHWVVGFTTHPNWESVLTSFPVDEWKYLQVIE